MHQPLTPLTATALLKALPAMPANASLIVDHTALLGLMYPSIRIEPLIVRGTTWSPAAIAFLARYLRITPNMMFMASPSPTSRFALAALGGVRVVTRSDTAEERSLRAHAALAVLRSVAADANRDD